MEKASLRDTVAGRSKQAIKGCTTIRKAFQIAASNEDVWGLPTVDTAHFRCQEAIRDPALHSSQLDDRAVQVVFQTQTLLKTQERVLSKEKSERQAASADVSAMRGIEMRIQVCGRTDTSDSGTQVSERIRPWLQQMGPIIKAYNKARDAGVEELREAYGDLVRLRYRVFEEIIRGQENRESLSPEDANELMTLYEATEPPSELNGARQARAAAMVGLKTRLS